MASEQEVLCASLCREYSGNRLFRSGACGHDKDIRESLKNANPVLLVRENQFVEGVTHIRFPLDVAIIDGYSSNGLYHVRFPFGSDRQIKGTKSGYVETESLFRHVYQACLIFVR